jgi:hypothetical protein
MNIKSRRAGYRATTTVLVLFAVVLINLIAARIPLELDLSRFSLYSLSDQSKTLVASLGTDVTIYACYMESEAPPEIGEALKRYREASSQITIRHVELERDPGFAARYSDGNGNVTPGSLVVVDSQAGRFRIIRPADLYEIGTDQSTGKQTIQGVQVERQVTGALAYVASGKTYRLYELAGHGEYTLAYLGLSDDLSRQSNQVSSLDILSSGGIPDDADLVIINSPEADLGESEAEALRRYLERGGDAVVAIRPGLELPRLAAVLATYGLRWETGIVMEGNEASRIAGNPFFLIPELSDHEISAPLIKARLGITFPASAAFFDTELKRRDAAVTAVLKSSSRSWLRRDMNNADPARLAGDTPGPFTLACAVQVDSAGGNGARLVISGSSFFIDPQNPSMGAGNRDIFLNMLSWALDRAAGTTIAPKYYLSLPMETSEATALLLMAIFIVAIPGGILLAGLVVWLRRRNM